MNVPPIATATNAPTVAQIAERLVIENEELRAALSTLLAWDQEFSFCNVDEGIDTPCICQSHPMGVPHYHDATCEKYRTLVRMARALVPVSSPDATENTQL